MKRGTEKLTIGCRVTPGELEEIDAICRETGQSRSDWLRQLVAEALGQDNPESVRKMAERLTAIERKLLRLAG